MNLVVVVVVVVVVVFVVVVDVVVYLSHTESVHVKWNHSLMCNRIYFFVKF